MTLEYGIVHHRTPDELHRGPMSREEAIRWVVEFEEAGGALGAFLVVSRFVSDWDRHTDGRQFHA